MRGYFRGIAIYMMVTGIGIPILDFVSAPTFAYVLVTIGGIVFVLAGITK